jgi:hypothetical protein
MAAPYKYEITAKSAMMWANSELEHVGRIAAVKDKKIQYAYALSTLNGMAHLKDALYELVSDSAYKHHKPDLLKTHDAVIRVMKQLIKDYDLNLETVRKFNTGRTLSNLSYLKNSKRSTRKNRK